MGVGVCASLLGKSGVFSQKTTSVPAKDLEHSKGGSCSRNNSVKIDVELGHLVRPEQLGCPLLLLLAGWGASVDIT